ncbi:hypothetical protein ACFL6C_12490 [Myxococcota bacterium]
MPSLVDGLVGIRATATVGDATPTTWTGNADCPTGTRIILWGAEDSVQYFGGGMTHWYARCEAVGNAVQASLYTDGGYAGHSFACFGLCVTE